MLKCYKLVVVFRFNHVVCGSILQLLLSLQSVLCCLQRLLQSFFASVERNISSQTIRQVFKTTTTVYSEYLNHFRMKTSTLKMSVINPFLHNVCAHLRQLQKVKVEPKTRLLLMFKSFVSITLLALLDFAVAMLPCCQI